MEREQLIREVACTLMRLRPQGEIQKQENEQSIIERWRTLRASTFGQKHIDLDHKCSVQCTENGMIRVIPGLQNIYGCISSGKIHRCDPGTHKYCTAYVTSQGTRCCIISGMDMGSVVNTHIYQRSGGGGDDGGGGGGDYENTTERDFDDEESAIATAESSLAIEEEHHRERSLMRDAGGGGSNISSVILSSQDEEEEEEEDQEGHIVAPSSFKGIPLQLRDRLFSRAETMLEGGKNIQSRKELEREKELKQQRHYEEIQKAKVARHTNIPDEMVPSTQQPPIIITTTLLPLMKATAEPSSSKKRKILSSSSSEPTAAAAAVRKYRDFIQENEAWIWDSKRFTPGPPSVRDSIMDLVTKLLFSRTKRETVAEENVRSMQNDGVMAVKKYVKRCLRESQYPMLSHSDAIYDLCMQRKQHMENIPFSDQLLQYYVNVCHDLWEYMMCTRMYRGNRPNASHLRQHTLGTLYLMQDAHHRSVPTYIHHRTGEIVEKHEVDILPEDNFLRQHLPWQTQLKQMGIQCSKKDITFGRNTIKQCLQDDTQDDPERLDAFAKRMKERYYDQSARFLLPFQKMKNPMTATMSILARSSSSSSNAAGSS